MKITSKTKQILRSKRGVTGTVDFLILFLLVMMLLVFAISLFPVFTTAIQQNDAAGEVARYIEIRGEGGAAALLELERINSITGVDSTLEIRDVTFFDGTKIQLGASFTVVLQCKREIGIGGLLKLPVTLTSRATGRSEKLWK